MLEGCNLFSTTEINIDNLIKQAGIDPDKVLFIKDVNGWLKKDKQNVVIEYHGLLSDEDDDKYAGYYYYDVMADEKADIEKLKKLNIKNIVVE